MNPSKETTACQQHTTVVKEKHQRHYRQSSEHKQDRFKKENLPLPIDVLRWLGITVSKTNNSEYLSIFCPFHKNGQENTPSLNIHKGRGNYRCHACGAKGGDILAFYMSVKRKDFIQAAKDLGAWEVNHD